jgi:hypothetical protein
MQLQKLHHENLIHFPLPGLDPLLRFCRGQFLPLWRRLRG